MSRSVCMLILLLHFQPSWTQNRANVWQLGNNPSMGTNYPGFGINFSSGTADTFTVYRSMRLYITNASICDTTGQLLFYTNGVWIANRNHDSLQNCQDFNPGFWTEFYGDEGLGAPQAAIILPHPGDPLHYGVFSVTGETGNFYGKTFAPLRLSYSSVDITLDTGLGGIESSKKNIPLVEDTLVWGRLTACKHANGRDWWVVTHKTHSDKYYMFHYGPDSVVRTEQHTGNFFTSFDADGMAVFSPDGSQYAHLNINDTIDLLQFDRCTGEFYNHLTLAVPDSPVTLSATLGCQFSANSRFLYVNSYRRLWQFDTWAPDVQASRILIDTTNNFEDKFLQQLAPDNKIYISTFNSNGQNPFLNVIHSPDSAGLACNFEVGGLPLPATTTNSGIPNFPNYDLGPLSGSPCDTLYSGASGETKQTSTYRLQPNPVHDWLNIIYQSDQDALFTLYDMHGRVEATVSLYHYFRNRLLDVSDLPQGIYFAEVTQGGEMVWSEKVVVLK